MVMQRKVEKKMGRNFRLWVMDPDIENEDQTFGALHFP